METSSSCLIRKISNQKRSASRAVSSPGGKWMREEMKEGPSQIPAALPYKLKGSVEVCGVYVPGYVYFMFWMIPF